MKIVISNDDSIHAQGLKKLADIAKEYGDVTVVAPDRPRSGQSHAVTFTEPLRLFKESTGFYQCSGTPADCVKIAIQKVLGNEKPDFVLSGINHGSNASTNIIYSGTMAAAIEGALTGIPSIGFSTIDHSFQVDFSKGEGLKYVEKILETAITHREELIKANNGTPFCWNVNFPNIKNIKGIKIARQSYNEVWKDIVVEREDFFSVPYYWIAGELNNNDDDKETDLNALAEDYTTIVPVRIDWTAHEQILFLKNIFN
ncbi:MAG: 5'/3'-nucleotidase SurE [Bacteroidales bacterium]|jgi:5'-nucleotidase|nr:5'/3'-nucleotidase SurE [Bacteroidales bacterium]